MSTADSPWLVMVQKYKILININLRCHCYTTVTSQDTRPVSSKCFESDSVIRLSSVNAGLEVPDNGKTAPQYAVARA